MRVQPTCSVEECGKPRRTRGMCNACYERWRKHGTAAPRKIGRAVTPPEQRVWQFIDKAGPVPAHRPELGPCWDWTGSKRRKGYGSFRLGWRQPHVAAHRFIYELLVGPIPEGMELDHLCRRTCCVRPTHLEPVTGLVNIARAAEARTTCRRGHPFAGNEIIRPNGTRTCRQCSRTRIAAWKRAHRAKGS